MATAISNLRFLQPVIFAGCFFFLNQLHAEWELSYILTPSKEYNSLRLQYKDPSPFKWTFTELTVTPSGVRFILNFLLCPLNEGKEADLSFKATVDQSTSKELKGHLFAGGEKILISENDTAWLIKQLLNGHAIDFEVERYKISITSSKFRHLWSKAKHLLLNDKIALQLK